MSSQKPPKKKSKQVENKQETLLSWVKPCRSDPECVIEETIRIKEQPRNENNLESLTTIAGDNSWQTGSDKATTQPSTSSLCKRIG